MYHFQEAKYTIEIAKNNNHRDYLFCIDCQAGKRIEKSQKNLYILENVPEY